MCVMHLVDRSFENLETITGCASDFYAHPTACATVRREAMTQMSIRKTRKGAAATTPPLHAFLDSNQGNPNVQDM
jgi:hypothetical protein